MIARLGALHILKRNCKLPRPTQGNRLQPVPRNFSVKTIDVDSRSLTDVGKQLFDNMKFIEAEVILKQSASVSDSEAQYQLGLLLTTQQEPITNAAGSRTQPSSNAAEVKNEIKKLRKESLMAKQVQSGSMAAFQKSLQMRQESKLGDIKIDKSTAADRNGMVRESEARKKEGLSWLRAAADQGHANALCYLGNLQLSQAQSILDELLNAKNALVEKGKAADLIAESVSLYERAAALDNAAAAFNLGVLYHDGISCDLPAPAVPSTRAREESTSNASAHATTTTKNHNATVADAGSEIVLSKVSNRQQKRPETTNPAVAATNKPTKCHIIAANPTLSLQYFKKAAALGESAALLWVGCCYSNGEGGVGEAGVDLDRAIQYLQTAAELEESRLKAHFYLAQIYRSQGDSAVYSATNANAGAGGTGLFVQHLRLSAEGGDEDALNCLADLHLQQYVRLSQGDQQGEANSGDANVGDDDELSTVEVQALLKQDLQSSVITHDSCHHHEGCTHDHHSHHQYQQGGSNPATEHLIRAVSLFGRASAAGQATATLTLGALTYQGLVHSASEEEMVDNKRRAFELYNLAAEQGSTDAWRNLASMYYLGDGVPKSEVTAREIMKVVFGK